MKENKLIAYKTIRFIFLLVFLLYIILVCINYKDSNSIKYHVLYSIPLSIILSGVLAYIVKQWYAIIIIYFIGDIYFYFYNDIPILLTIGYFLIILIFVLFCSYIRNKIILLKQNNLEYTKK